MKSDSLAALRPVILLHGGFGDGIILSRRYVL
jgi:hypothetical protein